MSELHFAWKPAILWFFTILGVVDFIDYSFKLIKKLFKRREK